MWRYHNPVRVHFGLDCFDQIAGLIAGRRFAVVTYGDPSFADLVGRLAKQAGKPALIIDSITPNPDFASLTTACSALAERTDRPEVIVPIGGGSVLDAAKVLAVGYFGFEAVRQHLQSSGESQSLPAEAIPLLAVPTTAGTGSEVTSWATVWDTDAAKKYSLARADLFPTDAVVDPGLMVGMPRELTISTGLDALSHALESLWNVNANPVSTSFAVAAAREVLETLGPLAQDLGNPTLRERMARAATMAGLAFSNTRTALAHSLSYPITLHHGVPHGIACSFTLPSVMRSVIGADERCDAALRGVFGADLERGAQGLADLLTELGIAVEPGSFGIGDADWRHWIDDAIDGERGRNFIGVRERVHDVLLGPGSQAGRQSAG